MQAVHGFGSYMLYSLATVQRESMPPPPKKKKQHTHTLSAQTYLFGGNLHADKVAV